MLLAFQLLRRTDSGLLRVPLIALSWVLAAGYVPAAAQSAGGGMGRHEVFVNSEVESYLRLLQTTGAVPLYPWSIRSFSLPELDRMRPRPDDHPWAGRYHVAGDRTRRFEWGWVRPATQVIYNSAFPFGHNNGAVWAGRGVTLAHQVGLGFRLGPLSLTLAPQVFWAENAAFELMPNGQEGRLAFADGRRFADNWQPFRIDLPQRFGDGEYSRVDPGQSTIRLDLAWFTAGLSTANQHWGPAVEQPIILGNNAPGYLHGFLGTSMPVNLWIGRLHGRLVWGRLEHSPYAPIEFAITPLTGKARFTAGMVAAFTPRGVPGLEVGAARFFHDDWTDATPTARQFLKPLETLLKVGLADLEAGDDGSEIDNQIASVFLRWTFPGSGLEAYGEFGRYDHSWDMRDFILEPDHDSAYLLGVRKVWQLSNTRLLAMRGEVLNTSVGHLHQVRSPQVPYYVHSWLPQGHTHRGQLLGAPAGYGGGGSVLALDYYHPGGRVAASWRRELRQERGNYWWDRSPATIEPEALDVVHTLGAEALVFRGRWEFTAGLAAAYNLNRDYRSDVFNLHATLQVRAGL